MGWFLKFKLLLWKNFLLQRRHKYQTIFEILSPVIFSMFLILIRCLVQPHINPATNYDGFSPTYFNISTVTKNLGNATDTTKTQGTVAFSPETPLTRALIVAAITTVATDNLGFLSFFFDPKTLPVPKGFKNAYDLEYALTQPNAMKTILCGIQFDDVMANNTVWPDHIKVWLRFPSVMRTPVVDHPIRASWRTNLLFPIFPQPGPRWPEDMYGGKIPGYVPEMFVAVQHALSREIIKNVTGQSKFATTVQMRRFNQPSLREDALLIALERFISMIIMLCFAYTYVNTVRVVTVEKELQLKETMTIMGLPSWLHWAAWFVKQFSFLFISIIIMVILIKLPLSTQKSGGSFSVLTFTPWSVLLFFFVLYTISSLCFSFMVSVFFSRANTAASFMGLAWLTTYSFFMMTQVLYEDIALSTKLLLSLISNTNMGFAFQMMVVAEGSGKGLHWGDFLRPVSYHDTFKPIHVALMFLFDSVLYMLIAMYVEKIRPGMYGVPLPWYFPFTKSFWRPNRTPVEHSNIESEYSNTLLPAVHDEEPQGVPIGVNIKNLTKQYKGRKKVVDNLNLRMYQNEITILLGHNGAGKTTTISMITGMVNPTYGTAIVNGYDIVTETAQARESLGICPQHNVLFPDLSVAEHITFYSRLKGVKYSDIPAEIDHFLNLLELQEKRNTLSVHLSGGQKRRLSVACAMCGNSRVVLLDEPTSGLDPAARRSLWDLLLKEKKGRTMILTTHFMDEADVLGDRIAIMAGGHLQCVGTPYFLKKHYGIGYKMTIVKEDDCDVGKITQFFQKYVPDIRMNTNIGLELTYIISNDFVSRFPEMLKDFEEQKVALKVSSYGLSVTSLEEVFMKAGAEDYTAGEPNARKAEKPEKPPVVIAFENNKVYVKNGNEQGPSRDTMPKKPIEPEVRESKTLLRNHIKAMFLKLLYNALRNKLIAFIQILTPLVNITISVIISRSWNFIRSLPPLSLSLESGFSETETLVSQKDLTPGSLEEKAMNAYIDFFKTSHTPGMKYRDIGTLDMNKFYLKLDAIDHPRMGFETLIGATFSPNNITAWFSNYGYHDAGITLATVNNAILRAYKPKMTLDMINYPLPYSVEQLVKVMASGSSMGFQFAFNMGFCMAFVTAFIVLFYVKERVSGAKHLQRVSGVRPTVMWACAYVFDWLWLFVVFFFIVIWLAIYQENTLSTPAELGRVLLVMSIFAIAAIPQHYLASQYFEAAASGFSKMCFLNMFFGCMPFLIIEVLRLPEVGSDYYANIFDWLFMPLPLYCLSRSFRDMSVSSFQIMACNALCDHFNNIKDCSRQLLCDKIKITVCCIEDNPYLNFSEPGIGRYLYMMILVGIISYTILMMREYQIFEKMRMQRWQKYHVFEQPPLPDDEDSDVAEERQYVSQLSSQQAAEHSLVCKDLTKYYKKFLAVKRLSFAVRRGECFGLLGINGAGKTSTFRMLTGDSSISCGGALVHGLPVKTRIRDVHRLIGYCPQFDALFENLTARETLRIFCFMRGIPIATGVKRAAELADALGFTRHFDKKVYECSGGTKRKISTAVALLGDSPLIFLDEPTTGMDPASKRLVWSSISDAVASGRSIVLTSHSMEECEALCSRLTVMVGGRLFCLGPLQHLKTKFSQGYTLIVKCKFGPDRDQKVTEITQFILKEFREARLVETYLGISTYYLNDEGLPWWKVFEVMEQARASLPIEDYSVTQTTLEQVFLMFTRNYGYSEDT